MLNGMDVRFVITTLLFCLGQANSTTDPPPFEVDTTESTSASVTTVLETTTIYKDLDTTKSSETTTVVNGLDTTVSDGFVTTTVSDDSITTTISDSLDSTTISESSSATTIADGLDTTTISDGSVATTITDGLDTTTISDDSAATTISDSSEVTTISDSSGTTNAFESLGTTTISDGLSATTVSNDSDTTTFSDNLNTTTVSSVLTTIDIASDETDSDVSNTTSALDVSNTTISETPNTTTADVSNTTTTLEVSNTTVALDVSNTTMVDVSNTTTSNVSNTTPASDDSGSTAGLVRCGTGWVEGPSKCYKFNEEKYQTRDNARIQCGLIGDAKLLSVEDITEMNWILQELEQFQYASDRITWVVNLEKRSTTNGTKWFWETDVQLNDSSLVRWDEGQPNNEQNAEHCVIMWCCPLLMNDINCLHETIYICEMEKDIIHGGWSEWTSFGPCSVNCESGTRHRSRKCNNPEPILGGDDCIGESLESSTCDTGLECCAPQIYDLGFMIDVTYSWYLSQAKTLLKDIVTKFDIGYSKTRISVATFSTTQNLLFDFVTYTNATQIQNALDAGIKSESGVTNPREALDYVRGQMFQWWNGARDDVTDVLVFFITKDDYSYDNTNGTIINDDPKVTAQKLKDAGVYIVALEGYDKTELETYSDIYHSFYKLYSSERPTIISKIETGFPCQYFCSVSAFSFDVPETLGTGNDSSNGTIFLMTDSSFQLTCCGATSTWEFFAVNYGTIEVMIFRLDGFDQYYLAGSTRIVIPEDYIGKVVSFDLIDGERVAFVKGDLIGWYSSGPNIVGHGDCTIDARSDCPQNNKLLQISRDSFEVGSTLDFSTATTVSGRGYSLKLTTINNTELTIEYIEEYTEIEENSPIGFDATYISVTDTDLYDDFNMTLSGEDELFEITDVVNERATIKLRQKLPKVGGPYVMTVTGTDSCQHTASTTVTVGKYNAPPIVNNLPYITEISELTKSAIHLYTINVTDASNDPICCTISKTLPNTYNFEFNEDNGVYSIWTVANPTFSYFDADSFRVFICCNDPYGATTSYLMVRLTENKIEEEYVTPEWFNTAIIVSIMPISILTMFTFFILVITLFCMDPEPDKPWEHEEEEEFEHSIRSVGTFSEDNTDSTSIRSSLSDQMNVKKHEIETSPTQQEETIHVKNAFTEQEFFIPIWRRKGQSSENKESEEDDILSTNSSKTKGAKNRTFPKSSVYEKPQFGEPGKLGIRLFSFGGDPSISIRTKEERDYEVNMKKNNFMLKYKEALLKAGTMKNRKSTATFPKNKRRFNSGTKNETIEMVTKAEVHVENETEHETETDISPETDQEMKIEITPKTDQEMKIEITSETEQDAETEITPRIKQESVAGIPPETNHGTETETTPGIKQEMETGIFPETEKTSVSTMEEIDEILDNVNETTESLA